MNISKTFRANGILFLAAIIWGCAFGFQRQVADEIHSITVLGIRFAIALICLLPFFLLSNKNNPSDTPVPSNFKIKCAIFFSGITQFSACAFQQWGIESTTAGNAGFITGIYVVIIPLLGLLWGQQPGKGAWYGVILATLGLYLLSVKGSFEVNHGDFKILICAFICAIHGHLIGWLSPKCRALKLAFQQYLICAIFGLGYAIYAKNIPDLSILLQYKIAFLYLGVFSTACGFTLQIIGQKIVSPTHAAIILSLETVFAALTGYLMLGEILSTRALIGCGLMLAGMFVAQLWKKSQ